MRRYVISFGAIFALLTGLIMWNVGSGSVEFAPGELIEILSGGGAEV